MAQSNIEQVKRMADTFNRRDLDAFFDVIDPCVEWVPIMAALEGRVYRGHEGVRQWLEDLATDWEIFETHQEEFRELGDRVLVFGRWRARARGSGVELEAQPASWLIDLHDGRIVRLETYTNREDAIEASGRRGHVEALKAVYARWAVGDFETPDIFDPEVRAQLTATVSRWLAASEECRWEADRFIPLHDQVLVLFTSKSRAKGSGAPVESPRAHLWTFGDRNAMRLTGFDDQAAALEAVGLPASWTG